LGEYERGYRIAAAFSPTGRPEDLGPMLPLTDRILLVTDLSLVAADLGRLEEARTLSQLDEEWTKATDTDGSSIGLQNAAAFALLSGRLPEARAFAGEALTIAETTGDPMHQCFSRAYRAFVDHAIGDIAAAREGFALAVALEGGPLISQRGMQHVRHQL